MGWGGGEGGCAGVWGVGGEGGKGREFLNLSISTSLRLLLSQFTVNIGTVFRLSFLHYIIDVEVHMGTAVDELITYANTTKSISLQLHAVRA